MNTTRLLIVLALLCSASPAQISIKGHYIGETAADFLKAEPVIDIKLTDCHVSEPPPSHQVTLSELREAERNHRPVDMDGKVLSKKEAESMVAEGKLVTKQPDNRSIIDIEYCAVLHDALEVRGHHCKPFMDVHQSHGAVWRFSDGRLVEILIDFSSNDVERVIADFTERVGFPPEKSVAGKFNVYGAQWQDDTLCWNGKNSLACLRENNNPAVQSATLHVASKDFLREIADEDAMRPSPLDK